MADLSDFYRGDTREYTLTFVDGDGTAIDISEWTIFFTMKEKESDADGAAAIKKDITPSMHSNPESGETKFTLEASDTNALQGRKYYFDIQAKKANGDIITVMKGRVRVLIDVTRRTT